MLIRLAEYFTRRAKQRMGHDTRSAIRTLKAAWVLRALASWLRGGEWRSFASIDAAANRHVRQGQLPADTSLQVGVI